MQAIRMREETRDPAITRVATIEEKEERRMTRIQADLVTARLMMVKDRVRDPEDQRVRGRVDKVTARDQDLKGRDKEGKARADKVDRVATRDQGLRDNRAVNSWGDKSRRREEVVVAVWEEEEEVTTAPRLTHLRPTTCGLRRCLRGAQLHNLLHNLTHRLLLLLKTRRSNKCGQLGVLASKTRDRASKEEAGDRISRRSNNKARRAKKNSSNLLRHSRRKRIEEEEGGREVW